MPRYLLSEFYNSLPSSTIGNIVFSINHSLLTKHELAEKYGLSLYKIKYIYNKYNETTIFEFQRSIGIIRQRFNAAPITTDEQGNKVKLVRSIPEFWDIADEE